MRRTQLYLDDQLWGALHARARSEKTTISELVRQAVRERYLGDLDRRRAAMQREVRRLRRGSDPVLSKWVDLSVSDALIAATAVGHGAVLWTLNRKHYPMEELSLFD